MGLRDGKTEKNYYEGQEQFGGYQFVSLFDLINMFNIAYVGDSKIIRKMSHVDIAFFAQRALAELSFDTLKSIKAQEIILPPSLTMVLPHDYVNYTKVSWVDTAGIKHPLVKTNSTSNPFSIKQKEDGDYFFEDSYVAISNGDFAQPLSVDWSFAGDSNFFRSGAWDGISTSVNFPKPLYIKDTVSIVNDTLEISTLWQSGFGGGTSRAYGVWQHIDVSNARTINLSADGVSAAEIIDSTTNDLLCGFGVIRVGLTTTNPAIGWPSQGTSGLLVPATSTQTLHPANPSPNQYAEYLDVGYVEWSDGSSSTKELNDIDVSGLTEVWVYIQSFSPWTQDAVEQAVNTNTSGTGPAVYAVPSSANNTPSTSIIDSITITVPEDNPFLSKRNEDGNSNAFTNYKSNTPSENNNNNYQDDNYWPINGSRYGLDPQHAQVNGSYFIDQMLGKIHFSSNILGKTVILDYISDSLGTNKEMQVHKFAEEAMYKHMIHAIVSTSSWGQQLVPRLTKEKFAAIRKAKLRLSNIKLEELTQILRGKSKQIKH